MRTNSIIRRFVFSLLGMSFFFSSFSQENYLSGYVINLKGDTISGFIDYRNWEVNPNKIDFKEKINSKPKIFSPNDILEFGVKDEIYVSAIVDVETSPEKISKLQEDPKIHLKKDTAFLETLYKGDRSLYYFNGAVNKKDEFYVKNDTGFELLIYKKYLKKQNGIDVIVENKKFLGQLIEYLDLNNCPSVYTRIGRVGYDQKSLEGLFQSYYNKCSASKFAFQKKMDKVVGEIGTKAGVTLSTLKFKSSGSSYLVNTDFTISVNLAAGFFYNIILPRNLGKWSVNNEILFTSYNITGKSLDFINDSVYNSTTSKIGYSYLKINNLICFSYPVRNIRFLVSGGMSNAWAVSENNHKTEVSKFYSTTRVTEGKAIDRTRMFEEGFVVGTGIQYNKFSFEIRFERGNGMSDDTGLNSLTKRFYFLLGYRL